MHNTQKISNVVKKYVQGECNKDELDYAISLFEEPYQNMEIRPQLFRVWNNEDFDVHSLPSKKEFSEVLNEVHHQINLKQKEEKVSKAKHYLLQVSKLAAVLILGAVIGLLVNKYQKSQTVYFTSLAPKGSVSQMILPDSSLVYLNAGSQLKYVINPDNTQREVYLSGEAWFDVKRMTHIPFVVHTSYYDINVLGTQFNVKAYPEDNTISTTLEEGSIQISSTKKFQIQSNQILKPGEQLIYNKQANSIELKRVNARMYSSWKDNKLIFVNMSLGDLLVLMERKYGVDIEVRDKSILNFHYDGTIKNESIIEMLEVLNHTLPIEYYIEDQKIIITKTNSN
jgi:ferric-dicitrate binding protein FerR (iron transport regulator)